MNPLSAFTPKSAAAFLDALSETASVTLAAAAAGVSRQTVYNWRKEHTDFAVAWLEALKLGTAALEDEAVRRAHEGVDEPVFYKGAIVGQVKKYSDTLLIFLLKAHEPEKYREKSEINHTGDAFGIKDILKRIDGTTTGIKGL